MMRYMARGELVEAEKHGAQGLSYLVQGKLRG